MRKSIPVVVSVVGVVLVGVAAYRLGRGRAPRAVDATSATAERAPAGAPTGDDRLVQSMDRMERRLSVLELRQLAANAAGSQAAPKAPDGPPDFEALKEKEQDRAEAIAAALKSQVRDGAWASAMESELQGAADAAAKDGAQFKVQSVRCLTSLCEIVLSASKPDELSRGTAMSLARGLPDMGSLDIAPTQTEVDGTATATLRLFRKGYPRPDQGT